MNCGSFFGGKSFLPGGILVLVLPGTVSSSIFQTFGSKAHAAANYHRHPGHPGKLLEDVDPLAQSGWCGRAGGVEDMLNFGRRLDFSPGFTEAVGQ
jgi:hypothetical protein